MVCGASGYRYRNLFAEMRYLPFTLCVFFAVVLVIMVLGIRYGNFP